LKTIVSRYLSALRTSIDTLPKYILFIVALTIDALNRYREMFSPITGSLTNEVQSSPIRNEEEAVKLFQLYLNHVKKEAKNFSQDK
jgi:hypothetical protein